MNRPSTRTIYIKSPNGKWRKGEIVQELENRRKWKIHYIGFSNNFDEIVDTTSDRLSLKPKGYKMPKQKGLHGDIAVDDHIFVSYKGDDSNWEEAVVKAIIGDQFVSYHIHYLGARTNIHDELISIQFREKRIKTVNDIRKEQLKQYMTKTTKEDVKETNDNDKDDNDINMVESEQIDSESENKSNVLLRDKIKVKNDGLQSYEENDNCVDEEIQDSQMDDVNDKSTMIHGDDHELQPVIVKSKNKRSCVVL